MDDNNIIDSEKTLSTIRIQNLDRLIFGNIKINSISSKFYQLKLIVQGKLDVLVVTETKID